jgi:hypothetical protein
VQSQEADALDGESVADLESLSRVRHRLLLTAELFDDALPDRLANDERRAGSGVGDPFRH